MRLIVAPRAQRDVQEIAVYYRRKMGTASWFTQAVDDAVTHLLTFPRSGVERSDLSSSLALRTWFVPPYLLVYFLEGDTLHVVAIVHASRDVQQALL